jgi:hypothetical protein
MLLARIAELGLAGQRHITRIGLTEIPVCGQNAEALRAHGLDAEGIANTVIRETRVV